MGLFSSKPSHPLADEKEMKRVLDSLHAPEAANALVETRAWLESLADAADLKAEQCLDLILRLDEATLPHARRLGRDYLTAPRLSRSDEYRLWSANHGYWTQLIAAYEYCLARHAAGDKAGRIGDGPLHRLYLRLLCAYAAANKWMQFRYGPSEGRFWQGCGRVYLAAVAARIDRKPLPVYPNGRESSVEQEYLQTLMLHSSSVNNLLPLEVEIAERLVAYLVPHLVFTDKIDAANVYWVDAAKALPPTRLAKVPEMTPTLRFLRPGAALAMIAAIRASIEQGGAVPPELHLGGQYPVDVVLGVLHHLAVNWQPKPPMRSHQRHQVKSRLAVIHGFEAIHDRLANGKNFFGDGSDEESWVAEDVSVGGMGAQVPLGANDWIRIGALVALQPEGGDNWLIATVRRFNRGDGRGAVGIQTIGKMPQALVADSKGLRTHVLLLDPPLLPGPGADTPLLPAVTVDVALESVAYEIGAEMRVQLDGQLLTLRQQSLVERGAEHCVVRCGVEASS